MIAILVFITAFAGMLFFTFYIRNNKEKIKESKFLLIVTIFVFITLIIHYVISLIKHFTYTGLIIDLLFVVFCLLGFYKRYKKYKQIMR